MEGPANWTASLRESDVAHRTLVLDGVPAEVLLKIAEEENAAVMVGRRGLGGFARLLLRSMSYRVVQQSSIPVVVIPPGEGP